ncbi:hypothetical protein NUSPORA_02535 [Nucleospora cyclopteri]
MTTTSNNTNNNTTNNNTTNTNNINNNSKFTEIELLKAQNKLLSSKISQLEESNFTTKKHNLFSQQKINTIQMECKRKIENYEKLLKIKKSNQNTNSENISKLYISNIIQPYNNISNQLFSLQFIRDHFNSHFMQIPIENVFELLCTTRNHPDFPLFLLLFIDWEAVWLKYFHVLLNTPQLHPTLIVAINFLPVDLLFREEVKNEIISFVSSRQQNDVFLFEPLFIRVGRNSRKMLMEILLVETFKEIIKRNSNHILSRLIINEM